MPARLSYENPDNISATMKKTISFLAGVALFGAAAFTSAEAPAMGSDAPQFTLSDTHGKEQSLYDFGGSVVVLEWINFDCPFVARHYASGHLPALQKRVTEAGGTWLAICSSAEGEQGFFEPEAMNERAEKEGFAGTAILYDTDGTVGRAFGAPVTPTIVIIGEDGTVAYWGAVDSDARGGAEDVTDYVTLALDALAAGEEIANPQTRPYGCSVKYAE